MFFLVQVRDIYDILTPELLAPEDEGPKTEALRLRASHWHGQASESLHRSQELQWLAESEQKGGGQDHTTS